MAALQAQGFFPLFAVFLAPVVSQMGFHGLKYKDLFVVRQTLIRIDICQIQMIYSSQRNDVYNRGKNSHHHTGIYAGQRIREADIAACAYFDDPDDHRGQTNPDAASEQQAHQDQNDIILINKSFCFFQGIVIGLGGALCVWGGVNLLEGYGQDNPASNAHVL